MRKLTIRDLLATLIITVQEPRGVAPVGIAGCLLAFALLGRKAQGTGTFEWVMVTLGVLTLGLAIAALIVETSWALLVPMMAGLMLMWGLALIRDAGYVATGHVARHA